MFLTPIFYLLQVYVSLIPIVGGVIVATLTELSFNFSGLMSALCSTATYALLNTFVKKVLKDTGIHHVKLLSLIAQFASVIFFPIWLYYDVLEWFEKGEAPSGHALSYVLMSGILNFAQNLVTFTLISELTALSYSVANTTKRIMIITVSLLTLRNPVTAVNILGMMMAVVGVFAYNRVRIEILFIVHFKFGHK